MLQNVLSNEELSLLVRGYDVVGDIAIIIIPPELENREQVIGEAVLASNKKIKAVARRAGKYGGEFRTLPLEIIAGENRKETLHREHGVRLSLHLEKVYFSMRSSDERRRIASLVKKGEEVLVMFSGIAAFPLVISAHSDAKRIVGIEKNPDAHFYGLKNLALNKKIVNVALHKGDVAGLLPRLNKAYDRILMPLPSHAENYLGLALQSLKNQGWLHFYEFQQKGSYRCSIEKVELACVHNGRQLVSADVVECGHTAPRTHRVCVDAQIE